MYQREISSDIKFDQLPPDGRPDHLGHVGSGDTGVNLLLCENSTNAEIPVSGHRKAKWAQRRSSGVPTDG